MVVVVGGLEWLVVACLHSGDGGGGVCGRVSGGVGSPGGPLVIGCRLRTVAGWLFLAVRWECLPKVVLTGLVRYVLGTACGNDGS